MTYGVHITFTQRLCAIPLFLPSTLEGCFALQEVTRWTPEYNQAFHSSRAKRHFTIDRILQFSTRENWAEMTVFRLHSTHKKLDFLVLILDHHKFMATANELFKS